MAELEEIVKEYIFDRYNTSSNSILDKYVKAVVLSNHKEAGISASSYTKYNKLYFGDRPKGTSVINYVLLKLNLAKCSKCKEIFNIKEFSINRTKSTGVSTWCKICFSSYQKNEPERWRYYKASRKSEQLLRTPNWSEIEEIKEFYNNCPTNYEVDHIVPLQGNIVSGLHVINNLQYLTKKENKEKSNKFNASVAQC